MDEVHHTPEIANGQNDVQFTEHTPFVLRPHCLLRPTDVVVIAIAFVIVPTHAPCFSNETGFTDLENIFAVHMAKSLKGRL